MITLYVDDWTSRHAKITKSGIYATTVDFGGDVGFRVDRDMIRLISESEECKLYYVQSTEEVEWLEREDD